jgi:hypothetical protein
MKLHRVREAFRGERAAFGLRSALLAFALRAIHRVMFFKVLRAMYVSVVDPRFTDCPPGLMCEFLSRDRLQRAARDQQYDLPSGFLEEALAKGDECYGILDGEELAAYGWYARTPTKIGDGLRLHFTDAYIYMYKGLTLDAYRGRRLHAIGMARALAAYRGRGYKGLVSYVEADNLRSLNSVYRMGYQDFGRVFIARVFGRYLTFHAGSCEAFGFRVVGER